MTTFTVTTAERLRRRRRVPQPARGGEPANATPEADMIVFAPGLEGGTLTLTQGELQLTQDVTIDGDQDNNGSRVTISGGHPVGS